MFSVYLLKTLAVGTLFWMSARNAPEPSGVRGGVTPNEAVASIWLVSGRDTLRTSARDNRFSITASPGLYQLMVDAVPGYKDILLERVIVEEGKMTDVGELVLERLLP